MILNLQPLSATLEPWQVQRATWNDLLGRAMIPTLPLRSLEEIEVERGKLRYDTSALWRAHCKQDKATSREVWSDTYKRDEAHEMSRRLAKLDGEYGTTYEILMGRWSLVYDPAGRELMTARGGNPDAFQAAMVSLANQHEASVRQAVADGKPVPLYVRRDYQDIDGGYKVAG